MIYSNLFISITVFKGQSFAMYRTADKIIALYKYDLHVVISVLMTLF